MKVTAYSRRYYDDEMDPGELSRAAYWVIRLCDIRIKMYDAHYMHTYHPGEPGDALADKTLYKYGRALGLDSYYSNSMEPAAKGILKSQVSNRKNYIDDVKDEIASVKEKLKETNEGLANKRAIKDAIVHFAKTGEWAKPYKKCTVKIAKDGSVTGAGIKQPCDYREYERTIEADIRRLKARTGNLTQAIRRREQKIENLKKLPPKRAVFGSRALYRQKDTVGKTKQWEQEFYSRRHRSVTLAGRADAPTGSWIVRYGKQSKCLLWKMPDGSDDIVFKDFTLANYYSQYLKAVDSHTSIGYTFEIRTDGNGRRYFIIKAAFDIPDEGRANSSFADGCIALDINYDRLAWSELSADGRQLGHGVIPMKLEGLSSDQAKDSIGRAVSRLAGICTDRKKPLVIEDLDAAGMKRKMKYANKKRNRRISQFACAKVTEIILSQAGREEFAVVKVNPAYTSFAGKVLCMRDSGQSVHEAASYMIGLKGLGMFPEPPEKFAPLFQLDGEDSYPPERETILKWKKLYQAFKDIPTYMYFRDLPAFQSKKEINAWVQACRDKERAARKAADIDDEGLPF